MERIRANRLSNLLVERLKRRRYSTTPLNEAAASGNERKRASGGPLFGGHPNKKKARRSRVVRGLDYLKYVLGA